MKTKTKIRKWQWILCKLSSFGHSLVHIENQPELKRSLYRCRYCHAEEYRAWFVHGDTTKTYF